MLPSNIPSQKPENSRLNPDRNLHIYGVEDCGEIVKLHWIDGANGEKGYTAVTRERFNDLMGMTNIISQSDFYAEHKYLTREELTEFLKERGHVQEANGSPAQESD